MGASSELTTTLPVGQEEDDYQVLVHIIISNIYWTSVTVDIETKVRNKVTLSIKKIHYFNVCF